jgi:HlyD family secretion protein
MLRITRTGDRAVANLTASLASLRIDRSRERPSSSRSRLIIWSTTVVAVTLGTALLGRDNLTMRFAAPIIETTQPTIMGGSSAAGGAPILTASGYVVARRKALISAKLQGRLAAIEVEEGTRVTAGQVIARLEDAEYSAQAGRARAALRVAEAKVEEERRQLEILERLVEASSAPTNQLEAARSGVRIASAVFEQACAEVKVQEALAQGTVIRAPFKGTIVKKMAEVGESVVPLPPGANLSTSTGAIVALADLDLLEVEADIGESHLGKLHDGQPAEVTVDAFPERRFNAALRAITPIADRTKATVLVHVTIRLAADLNLLRPEMAAKVTFVESEAAATAALSQRVVLLSRSAVSRRGAIDIVFQVRGDRVSAVAVQIGETLGDQVTVKSGLIGTEVLVDRPSTSLKDGDAVKVNK